LPELVGFISTISQLRDAFEIPQARAMLLKYPPSQKLVEEFESMVARSIANGNAYYLRDLKTLFFVAPEKAAP